MKKPGRGRHGRRSPVWRDDVAEAFLKVLRETGNVQAAIRAVGHGDMFYRRRREDPGFALRWEEAAAAADHDLRSEGESARSPFRTAAGAHPAGTPGSHRGEFPAPAAKSKSEPREPVIRRNRAGRLQLALARDGDWNGEVEARFLAHLRSSGNFLAAARAVGFHFTSIYERMRKWSGFAREVDEALREADVMLEYGLVGHANAVMRAPDEPRPEGEDEVPFDPAMAMKILAFIDARRGGRTMLGRRKGPPERTFEEAVESILAKVEAIKRHRELKAEDSPLPGREGPGVGASASEPSDSEFRPPSADPPPDPSLPGRGA
jgi:hypothetical protein